MNLSDDVDLEDFVARPDKISGADIHSICQEAGKSYFTHASTDEDDRLRTVHPSMWTTNENLGSDRRSHG